MPSKPCRIWFGHKYPGLAKPFIDWWEGLDAGIKKEVSPRRLEYAIQMYKLRGGDMRDVLPSACNVSQLITNINNGPAVDKLKTFLQEKNEEEARKYLAIENNFAAAKPHIISPPDAKDDWYAFFLPLLSPEKLSLLISTCDPICDHVLDHADKVIVFRRVMQDILAANTNKKLIRRIKRVLGDNNTISQQYGAMCNPHPSPPHFNVGKNSAAWGGQLVAMLSQPMDKTPQRMKIYTELAANIPETLSAQDAISTLEILNMTAGRCWPDTIRDIKTLPGVFNHCIEQLHKTTGLSWVEMLNLHGSKFETLLRKMTEAKIDSNILCPMSKKSIADLVLERHASSFKDTTNA